MPLHRDFNPALTLALPPAGSLPHAATIAVLGVPVRFEAETPELLAAAAAAYGGPWAAAPAPRVALLAAANGPAAGDPNAAEPLRIAADLDMLLLAGPGAAGRARLDDMSAVLRLSPGSHADGERFRAALDALVLYLVTRLDRQPVHAAAVASGGAGLVLAGRSGAGKSTLAYAALRAGLDVVSDDAVYVQLEPALHVWGLRRPLHLAPETAAWFPELAGRPAVLRANGKRRIVVPPAPGSLPAPPQSVNHGGTEHTENGGAFGPRTPPTRWALCLLERAPGTAAARAEPIAADEAVARVVAALDAGFDVWRETIGARLEALARGGAWRLRVGEDPRAAVAVMLDLLGRLAR